MNILYLTTHLNIGGISNYLLTLTKGMKQRNHHVYLASSGGELFSQFTAQGVECIRIPIRTKAEIHPKILFSLWQLLPLIRQKKIEIIHAQTRVTQVLASLISHYANRPFVSTCHGFFKNRISRRMFPCWGCRVIAISDAVKFHLRRDFKLGDEKIRVVYNGIDLEKFHPPTEDEVIQAKIFFALGNAPVVGIVARLSEVKGHIYLIEAMRQVLNVIPQAKLLIVGSGKLGGELERLVKSHQMQKSVYFLPSVKDTQPALAAMDVFVMPSLAEGLGLGLMEAMACGRCVVGSSVGGIRNLIHPGYSGMLVEPRDISGLRDAIIELLQNALMRESLGHNACDFICRNFSLEKLAQETERVYAECLGARI